VRSQKYDAEPVYAAQGGTVGTGWEICVATLPAGTVTVAVDGAPTTAWERVVTYVGSALANADRAGSILDVRECYVPWQVFADRTTGAELVDDPDFAEIATADMAALFDRVPTAAHTPGRVNMVVGPGAALVEHDVLWFADLPKRYAEAAIGAGRGCNLGAGPADGPPTTRRLFYIDWPILDRHRDGLLARVDRWVDTQDDTVTSVDGTTLRATAAWLSERPFRTRPVFNTTPWGGHWAQHRLGVNPDAENTALGYELIAPESGVLVGDRGGARVEIPFAAVVSLHPDAVLGPEVHEEFGTSFPVRFDYLDTSGGGNLSVHLHPQRDYMRKVFGWPYTQHETYYVMDTQRDRKVYLGLREGVDVEQFHDRAHAADAHGEPLDIEQFIQTFPADLHQLFCIPAGTPHGSGEGNVILEVSATPYLYSLRFYDWLRRGSSGSQRPVHVEHAFANLDVNRRGPNVVRDLVQRPRTLRGGDGWSEELLGRLPEMFYEVRRVVLQHGRADLDTDGRFTVLTVVDGSAVRLRAGGLDQTVTYAETIVVPAAVGSYSLEALDGAPARIVAALVP